MSSIALAEDTCPVGEQVIFNYTTTDNNITKMCMDSDAKSLIIYVNSNSSGTITIDIPRKAINPIISCEQDDVFFVLANGEEIPYKETKTTEKFRQLYISYPKGSEEIEIIGTFVSMMPERFASCIFLHENDRLNIPPLKQTHLGITPQEVICEEGLDLIQKIDGTPACIKPSTADRLFLRGCGDCMWNCTREIPIDLIDIDKDSSETIKILNPSWERQIEKKISAVSISDGGFVVGVGTAEYSENSIYLFDKNGNLQWEYKLDKKISAITISSDLSYVLASAYEIAPGPAGTYTNPSIYLFDIKGDLLWQYDFGETDFTHSVAFTTDAHVIAATQTKIMYLDKKGETLWEYKPEKDFGRVSISRDGYLIAASDDNNVILIDNNGKKLWDFDTEYEFLYALEISNDGKYVLVSDSDGSKGNLYFLKNDGSLLWKKPFGEAILNLEISEDNFLIIGATNWQFSLLDLSGNVVWTDNIPYRFVMSSDGSFLAGVSFNQEQGASMTLFDENGNIMSSYNITEDGPFSLSPDDKHFVIAGEESQKISFFEIIESQMQNRVDLSLFQNSNDLHMQVIPEKQNGFDVIVKQGDTIQIPWDIKIDDGYTTTNLEVAIKSPTEIQSALTPHDPYTTINGITPGNRTITIHPDKDTPAGTYAIQILGNGYTIHKQTGWMTSLEGKTLGRINVLVEQKTNPLSIEIGSVHTESRSFCVKLDEQNGGENFCQGGPTYQEIPVTVFADVPTKVLLSSHGVQGGWVKFVPEEILAGPNGTTSKMIMAGHLAPFRSNPTSEKSLIIEASSKNDSTTTVLPVFPGTISVIDKPSPIEFAPIRTSSNGTTFATSGVVYDPMEETSTISVNLSVLGMWDGQVVDMPNWLQVTIPESSFMLEAAKPYHFIITAKTTNAPESGTYNIAINQNVGGQDFVKLQEIKIENWRHG